MTPNTGATGPAFAHGASRARYGQAYADLKATFPKLAPGEFARRFIALEAQLDAGMIEVKTAMLTSGLFSNEDEQALGVWIYQQHNSLWQLGVIAANACASTRDAEPGITRQLVALTLLHCGEAVKWELMVGRKVVRAYKVVHALMQLALDRGWHREKCALVVDGLRRHATIENLHFRGGFLDRFSSGNLTRQQVEVLDAWLWEWMPALTGKARYPGGLVLRFDLDAGHGLRYGKRKEDGATLYLALAPLEELRKDVIKELHCGRVVPAQGRAANIRIEAHVAVLLALRRTFAGRGSEGLPRAPRQSIAGGRGEMLVGIAEILRGLQAPDPGTPSPARSGSAFDAAYDKPRRMASFRNASATGYLVELARGDAFNVSVGDLVGLRVTPGEPLVVARLVRRMQDQESNTVQLGLRLLSDPSKTVRVVALRADGGEKESFLFVPGNDSSGRFDTFAIPFNAFKPGTRYEVQVRGAAYTLEFNRVRHRGRGWALAGFEILEVRRIASRP
jgi:hypothetical protein